MAKDKNPETVSLTIPSTPQFLRVVRCLIIELATLAGFCPKDSEKICIAVDEACSNIMRHSYKGRTNEIIIVKCAFFHDRMKISLRDFGEKFDLSRIQPDSGIIRPGGYGVHLIKCIMDVVEYETTHDVGTEIHMTRFFPPPEDIHDSSNAASGKGGADTGGGRC